MSKNGNLKFKNKNAITDTEKGNARRRTGPDATDADLSKEFDDRTIGPFVYVPPFEFYLDSSIDD